MLHRINLSELKNLADIDNESFICCTKESELAEVLIETNEERLALKSDQFSLQCLKSLSKLINLLVSENLKLIYITYLISSPMTNELWYQIKFTIFQITRQLFIYKKISAFDFELQKMKNIVNLINSNDQKKDSRIFKKDADYEHQLSMYLRNALLNSFALCQVKDAESVKKRELLSQLKSAFEHCDIYLKKVVNDIEGMNGRGGFTNNTEIKLELERKNIGKLFELFQTYASKKTQRFKFGFGFQFFEYLRFEFGFGNFENFEYKKHLNNTNIFIP